MSDHLIAPHGGTLVNLVIDAERAAELKAAAADWPSWDLTPRQICDIELLMNGALLPAADVPRPGRLRERLQPDAPGRRHHLADADLSRPARRRGQLGQRPVAGPARPRGRHPGRAPRRRGVHARPGGRGPGGLRHHQPRAPRRRATCCSGRTPATSRVGSRAWPCRHHYDFRTLRQTPAELRDQFPKLGWTQDRRLPDPQPHAPRPPGADPARRQGGRRQPADPPGRWA